MILPLVPIVIVDKINMRFLIAALLMTSLVSPAWALKTVVVKNDRALIDLEGEDLQIGDKVGARDSAGKARALLEIKQIKNGKAVAAILKGKMSQEYSLSKIGGTKSAASPTTTKASGAKPSHSKSAWGVTAGYAMNSIQAKPSATTSVSMSGSSFNLSGFYQTEMSPNLNVRILGGYETLVAEGKAQTPMCNDSVDCKVDIGYLGIEAIGQYTFLRTSKLNAWAGAGLSFLFGINKTSNVFKANTNQTIIAALGVDYKISQKYFIPLQLDYAYYPDNNVSAANQIILRAGWGINF
nr:hypothetical protein HAGR004_13530 [Bdellovibrio sp. HAGR004]